MLSTEQKEVILRRAGIAVPPYPRRRSPLQQGDPSDRGTGQRGAQDQFVARTSDGAEKAVAAEEVGHEAAVDRWIATVDGLYADYALSRATTSLHGAEQARTRSTQNVTEYPNCSQGRSGQVKIMQVEVAWATRRRSAS